MSSISKLASTGLQLSAHHGRCQPHSMHCPCTCPADLTGTIPLSIRELTNLQHVFLSFNKLRGSLNGRVCTRRGDPLEVLILRANFFTGTVNMTGCQQLLLLDLTVGLQNPHHLQQENSKRGAWLGVQPSACCRHCTLLQCCAGHCLCRAHLRSSQAATPCCLTINTDVRCVPCTWCPAHVGACRTTSSRASCQLASPTAS